MRGILFAGVCLLAAAPAQAVDSIERIEACMRANLPTTVQVRDFELVSTDKTGGTRTLAGKLHARLENGLINATMRVEQPPDLRGAAYLVREAKADKDEEVYVYLPALQKVRRVNGGMKDSPLFGTDLSYADIKQLAYAFTGETLKLEKEDTLEKRPMWLLSMAPDPAHGARFDKVLAWIDQKTCMVLKAEFLSDGTVRKRFASAAKFLVQSGPHWYFSEGRVEDLQEKTFTDVRILDVTSGKDLADRLFNPRMFYVGN
ncbi:MAG: outer membrane lipoprotein-sorting protein [Panacagrimonas sp.]